MAARSFGSLFTTLLENVHRARRNKLIAMADQSCIRLTRLLRKHPRNKKRDDFGKDLVVPALGG